MGHGWFFDGSIYWELVWSRLFFAKTSSKRLDLSRRMHRQWLSDFPSWMHPGKAWLAVRPRDVPDHSLLLHALDRCLTGDACEFRRPYVVRGRSVRFLCESCNINESINQHAFAMKIGKSVTGQSPGGLCSVTALQCLLFDSNPSGLRNPVSVWTILKDIPSIQEALPHYAFN